jgi:hypothetical protein
LIAQIASLRKILNLNETVESSDADEAQPNGLLTPVAPILDADGNPIWKILVFDDLGRDVISSVMRVSDLRAMGVTMHLLVKFVYILTTPILTYVTIGI